MQRRHFIQGIAGLAVAVPAARILAGGDDMSETGASRVSAEFETIEKTEAEWREVLSQEEYRVLRQAGTEPAGSSKLLEVKSEGEFVCAGCGLPLFKTDWKFDSGTGWPSFYTYIDGHLGFQTDWKLIMPRKEYHCARCGGHQGHVFEDGPEPTGLRYCNNGVALDFVPVGKV